MKRRCPMCAEEIQAKAKLCKHCKSAVKPVETYAQFGWLMTLAILALGLYLGAKLVDTPETASTRTTKPRPAAAQR